LLRRFISIPEQVALEMEDRVKAAREDLISSQYRITVENENGRILESKAIIDWTADGPQSDSLWFSEVILFPESSTTVKIRNKTTVLIEYNVSPNIPEVGSVEVEKVKGGSLEVTWSADDKDGDTLLFDVLYGYGGGKYWKPLAIGHNSEAIQISNTEELPGTDQATIRVLASDGLNTAQADSQPFHISNKSPQSAILSPTEGSVICAGRTAVFEGYSLDREDGPLSGDSMEWWSDKVGLLGVGREIGVRELATGIHEISLIAVDGSGEKAIPAVLTIEVTDSPQDCAKSTDPHVGDIQASPGGINIPSGPGTSHLSRED